MKHDSAKEVTESDRAVVIVGGGPTGLTLAAELALAGVRVTVLERRPTQELVGSRARGLHARTIEVFEQRGVADRFLEAGKSAQVAGFSFIPLDISDFPARHNYGLALEQKHVERILAGWVDELPVEMLRGVDVVGFSEDDAGISVQLSDGTELRSAYLVGCDGGRSLVRKRAGVDFAGWEASVSYLIAEVEMRDKPEWGVRRGKRGVNALGPAEDGRVGLVLVEAEVSKADNPSLDEVRRALVAAYGTDFGLESARWISRFSDMARQATKYRKGRVILAGDAAHVHGPSGGLGLNIGVQDAMNLGWKLAQVVKGTCSASLLDTYHDERHPIGAQALRLTMAQSALGRGDDQTEALRETVTELLQMDAPRKKYAGMMSGLDVHYNLGDGHPLLGRRVPDVELAVDGGTEYLSKFLHNAQAMFLRLTDSALDPGPWASRVRLVDARYDGPWELPVVGEVSSPHALLIRPDGYVAWVGDGTDKGLREALARWFGSPS